MKSKCLIAVPENASKALEAQLAHRPDVQDLVDRNIIKGIQRVWSEFPCNLM